MFTHLDDGVTQLSHFYFLLQKPRSEKYGKLIHYSSSVPFLTSEWKVLLPSPLTKNYVDYSQTIFKPS